MEVINRENQKEYIEEINKIILNKNPKYIILTMGCQLNENDSEKLSGMIEKMGYTNTENIEEVLRQQDKLKDFIQDSEPRFELQDNALVVSKDGVGCRESHTFHLPENIITGIKENGVLDFSYIDGEWKKAIHDASMSKLLEF